MCKLRITLSVPLCLPGSAGPGQLARTPAVTSGLGGARSPAARTLPAGAGSVTTALRSQPRRAGGLGRQSGRPHGCVSREGEGTAPRTPRPGPSGLSGWVGGRLAGGRPGGGPRFPQGSITRRKPELCLCPSSKPVAWWGNRHASQVTAAGPGQKCPQPGAPRPLRGAGGTEPPRVGWREGSPGQGGPARARRPPPPPPRRSVSAGAAAAALREPGAGVRRSIFAPAPPVSAFSTGLDTSRAPGARLLIHRSGRPPVFQENRVLNPVGIFITQLRQVSHVPLGKHQRPDGRASPCKDKLGWTEAYSS